MSRTRTQARAARRATYRHIPLGFQNLVGIETCYYTRRTKLSRPALPEVIRNRYDKVHADLEFLAEQCERGDAEWATYDRVHNDRAHVAYRAELLTRTGLDYYTVCDRIAAVLRRNNIKEAALIRAARRHNTRIPHLRAAYGDRR